MQTSKTSCPGTRSPSGATTFTLPSALTSPAQSATIVPAPDSSAAVAISFLQGRASTQNSFIQAPFNALDGSISPCTTLQSASTKARGSFLWKALRPTQTPAPPARTESRMISSVSRSPAFSPPAMKTGTEQAETISAKDSGSPV